MVSDVSRQKPPASARKEAPTRRRLAVNYAFQLLNQLVRICEQLLLVPLFLAAWGAETYRDWVILYAVMIFLMTCNFGAETYFGNRFIASLAVGDRGTFRREFRLALFSTLCVGCTVLLAAYLILFGIGSRGLFLPENSADPNIYYCLVFMTFPVTFIFTAQALHTVYRAEGEFSRGECAFAIYAVVQMLSVALLLVLKMPPIVVASAYLVAPSLLLIGLAIDVRRRYHVEFGFSVPTLAELRDVAPKSLLFFMSPLSLSLVQSGPVMLFGVLGMPAVPVLSYTLIRTFTGLTRQTANQFAVGSGIEMARHYTRGEDDACRRLYEATGQVVTVIVGLLAGFSIWAAGPFLTLWTHGTVHSNPALVAGFLGGIFLAAPGQAGLMLLNYMNIARPLAAAWSSQAIAGLVISAALVPFFGVAAAAYAFAIAESVAVGLWLPFVVQRRFGYSAIHHLLRCFALGGLAFAWSAFIASMIFDLGFGGLKGLMVTAIIWAAIAIPPFALFTLPARHRQMLMSRLRSGVARNA